MRDVAEQPVASRRGKRREVDHDVGLTAGEQLVELVGAHVEMVELRARRSTTARAVGQVAERARGEVVDDVDEVALGQQPVDQVRADEPGAADDEHVHGATPVRERVRRASCWSAVDPAVGTDDTTGRAGRPRPRADARRSSTRLGPWRRSVRRGAAPTARTDRARTDLDVAGDHAPLDRGTSASMLADGDTAVGHSTRLRPSSTSRLACR